MSHFKFRFSRSALLILALFVMLPYPLCAQTAERPIRAQRESLLSVRETPEWSVELVKNIGKE